MSRTELIRHLDEEDIAEHVAVRLTSRLLSLQNEGKVPQLCLGQGNLANKVYARLAVHLELSDVDAAALELWEAEDNFVATDSPLRCIGPVLALFAGHVTFDPSRVHPMPAAEALLDVAVAADSYAKEVGQTTFDICLLQVNAAGEVAGISSDTERTATTRPVAAVKQSDSMPDKLTMSEKLLSNSVELWMIASGDEIASILPKCMSGDSSFPAGRVSGQDRTVWLVDRKAAAQIPYYHCAL